jgi:hypothetical protein
VRDGTVEIASTAQLSCVHPIDADALRRALQRTAEHRQHPLSPLAEPLDGHAAARQAAWTALRRRSGLDALSPDFRDVVDEVVRFVDPLVGGDGRLKRWLPDAGRWASATEVEAPASASADVRRDRGGESA